MIIKVIAEHVEQLQPVAELLGNSRKASSPFGKLCLPPHRPNFTCGVHLYRRADDYGGARQSEEVFMGKYLLGWLMGVPVIVLVLIYLLMH